MQTCLSTMTFSCSQFHENKGNHLSTYLSLRCKETAPIKQGSSECINNWGKRRKEILQTCLHRRQMCSIWILGRKGCVLNVYSYVCITLTRFEVWKLQHKKWSFTPQNLYIWIFFFLFKWLVYINYVRWDTLPSFPTCKSFTYIRMQKKRKREREKNYMHKYY